uniref:Uncharacterized protein n=1 Tax=Glossina palpalis gambiensis TaxID=67801 RepID=A0A1B0AV47_9MUSC
MYMQFMRMFSTKHAHVCGIAIESCRLARTAVIMALVNITNNATVTNTALCSRVYYYNNTSSDSSNVPTLFFRFLGAVIRQVHPLGVVVAVVVVVVVAVVVVVDEMHKDLYITLQAYRHTNTRLPHLYHFFSFLLATLPQQQQYQQQFNAAYQFFKQPNARTASSHYTHQDIYCMHNMLTTFFLCLEKIFTLPSAMRFSLAHAHCSTDKCSVNCNQKADKKRRLPSSDMHA